MAKPIEPTPPLSEEDSRTLLASLETGVSVAEMDRRRVSARAWAARLEAPKNAAQPSLFGDDGNRKR